MVRFQVRAVCRFMASVTFILPSIFSYLMARHYGDDTLEQVVNGQSFYMPRWAPESEHYWPWMSELNNNLNQLTRDGRIVNLGTKRKWDGHVTYPIGLEYPEKGNCASSHDSQTKICEFLSMKYTWFALGFLFADVFEWFVITHSKFSI